VLLTRPRALAAALALALAAGPAGAQIRRVQKATVELESAAVAPGAAVELAAVVSVEDGWHLQAHVPTYDYLIPTVLTVALPDGWAPAEVGYPEPERYEFAFAEDALDVYEGTLRLPVRIAVPATAEPGAVELSATLRYQACDDKSCLPPVDAVATAQLTIDPSAPAVPALASTAPSAPPREIASGTDGESAPAAPRRSLVGVFLLALVGGLILNAMPCVLPVLSLKLFGLVKAAGQSRGAVRAGALATTAGILVSFWALAGAAIVARSAGAAVGWGVQFQQPGFVAFLAVVVLLFSLNLWGLFEIPLPGRLARMADAGGRSEGLPGHFVSGLFATLMATPCSAPFLGTALSFALGQTAGTIFWTLTAVGLGLALPYVVLAVAPGAVRYLPKPGAWMDTLRGAMGFLLAAALVWLLYVLDSQISPEAVAFFELTLLALALAVWAAHRASAGGRGRQAAWVAVVGLAVTAILLAGDSSARADTASRSVVEDSGGIAWQPFDRAEAEGLAAEGRLVFLDITADWCVTCKVNERLILRSPEVVEAFRRYDVIAMKGDWTNRSDEIAAFLAEHDRYGIPFYLLYRPGRAPHVFGELISKRGVIDVLAQSATTSPAG